MNTITPEMIEEVVESLQNGGVQRLLDEIFGVEKASTVLSDFHSHTMAMVYKGADPITTVTAGFVAGFEVARRYFSDNG